MCKCPKCNTKLNLSFNEFPNSPDVAVLRCSNCDFEGEMIC